MRTTRFGFLFLMLIALSLRAELVHRYSFDGSAQSAVSAAHGVVRQGTGYNAGSIAFKPNGQMEMINPVGANSNTAAIAFVDLPNGMISALGGQASIGIWVTPDPVLTWSRIFDFGTSWGGEDDSSGGGATYLTLVARANNDNGKVASEFRYLDQATLLINGQSQLPGGQESFVVLTIDETARLFKLYVNGALAGHATLPLARLADFVDDNNWLGRSQYGDRGFNGLYNELRIWNHTLSAQEVQACYELGPDALPLNLVAVEPAGIVPVAEEGASATVSVVLSRQPAAEVQITLTPDTADLELNGGFPGDPVTLLFTPSNWSTPQTVAIAAVADGVEEGDEPILIRGTIVSADPDFAASGIAPVKVQVADVRIDPCPPADIDGDCRVTAADLVLLAAQWLDEGACAGLNCADRTADSLVNLDDYSLLSEYWLGGIGPVVISEFMANNASDHPDLERDIWEVFDESGEAADWIELFNISSRPVSLQGWTLSDDPDEPARWSFPDGLVLQPGAYLIVYASGRDGVAGDYIHTNFSLDAGGESLLLSDSQGRVVSAFLDFPPQQPNVSYGHANYFTAVRYFSPATPRRINAAPALGFAPDTQFSHDRGYYSAPFDLVISTRDPNAVIRYTLDGSEPGWDRGALFDPAQPLRVAQTTVLRARSFLPGFLPSNVDTQTYLFPADIKLQSPNGELPGPGWPADRQVNNQRMRYGMTPDIVNHATYGPLMEDALRALPVLSLVTDLPHLFDPANGIYVNAADARGDNDFWAIQKEKPCSLELIHSDGADGFQIDAGLRIRGGYSRSDGNPKHAFRFFFRSKYGQSKLEYPLFGEEGATAFDKIDLRTSQNYSWSFNNDRHNTFVREVFSRDMQGVMGQPYTRSRYYHLYINGQYWGIYQTQERVESRYAASNLGGQKEDYDVVKVDINAGYRIVATDGNFDDGWQGRAAYRRLYDAVKDGLADPNAYYRVQGMNPDGSRNPAYERLLDVDNLIAHMIINYYTADMDGPASRFLGNRSNNLFAVYNRANPDGWKWFEHDSEHSFGLAYGGENLVTPLTTAGSNFDDFNSQWLHEQLCQQNFLYRMRFADTVQKHFFNGGLFTPARVWQQLMTRATTIEQAIVAESARWGNSGLNRDTWYWALDWLRDYIDGVGRGGVPREQRVLAQFRGVGWFPALGAPSIDPAGGYLTPGQTVALSHPNASGSIWYTLDGSDPWLPPAPGATGVEMTLVAEAAPKFVKVPTQSLLGPSGGIEAFYFTGITGTALANLTSAPNYPDRPDLVEQWPSFSMPAINARENYGTRVRGLLYPPTTGDYQFWICSDDASMLWIGTDATEASKEPVAWIDEWTEPNTWYAYDSQYSGWLALEAGQPYYIEALQKEGSGGDHVQVAWAGPGIAGPVIIPGQYLSSLDPWTGVTFNQPGWTAGVGAVAYETRPGDAVNYTALIASGTNVRQAMHGKNATCYIRIPFQYSGAEVTKLHLTMRYDDGFAAWLNGVEIARDNAGTDTLAWNSGAAGNRDDSIALQPVTIDVSKYLPLLRTGANLLAIQGLNAGAGNSDFLITAQLTAALPPVGTPASSARIYADPIPLQQTVALRARVFDGNEWSAATAATFADGAVRDSLRVTELMYHPGGDPLAEFVELRNVGSSPVDLNLVAFTAGIQHRFGPQTLAPGGVTLLCRDLAAFETAYPGLAATVSVAQWTEGALDNAGERLTLVDGAGALVQTFKYADFWYPLTDGGGFSLTVANPAGTDPADWDRKSGWRASTLAGGSPGGADQALAAGSIVINELLAHSHGGESDWIELYNPTASAISLAGWYLTDDASTPDTIRKYEFPEGAVIGTGGYLTVWQDNGFGAPALPPDRRFGLSEAGETVYLFSGAKGEVTGFYQASQKFGASATGVTLGRYEKATLSSGYDFVALAGPTPGELNHDPLPSPLVMTEIHYNPPQGSDYEFVELFNRSGQPLTLMQTVTTATSATEAVTETLPWRINGIGFTFPANTTLAPGERIIIAARPALFNDLFGASLPAGTRVFGPCSGKLDNSGEEISVQIPGDQEWGNDRIYIDAEQIDYKPETPWPAQAAGAGASLQRLDPDAYGSDPANWTAANPQPGQ